MDQVQLSSFVDKMTLRSFSHHDVVQMFLAVVKKYKIRYTIYVIGCKKLLTLGMQILSYFFNR